MPDPVTAITVGVGAGASIYGSKKAGDASDKASKRASETAAQSEALNIERFDEAERMLSPYIQRSDIAQRQLMSELGLPVPAISPYMQEQNLEIEEQGQEEFIQQKLAERGIPQTIKKKVTYGPSGRQRTRTESVPNPA